MLVGIAGEVGYHTPREGSMASHDIVELVIRIPRNALVLPPGCFSRMPYCDLLREYAVRALAESHPELYEAARKRQFSGTAREKDDVLATKKHKAKTPTGGDPAVGATNDNARNRSKGGPRTRVIPDSRSVARVSKSTLSRPKSTPRGTSTGTNSKSSTPKSNGTGSAIRVPWRSLDLEKSPAISPATCTPVPKSEPSGAPLPWVRTSKRFFEETIVAKRRRGIREPALPNLDFDQLLACSKELEPSVEIVRNDGRQPFLSRNVRNGIMKLTPEQRDKMGFGQGKRNKNVVRCPLCTTFFSDNTKLDQHLVRFHYDGIALYRCPAPSCKARYASPSLLRGHIKYAHGPGSKTALLGRKTSPFK